MIQGYVDELSVSHVKGWAWDTENPARRLTITSPQLPLICIADQQSDTLVTLKIGDAHYGFSARFSPPLDAAARAAVMILADGHPLEFAPNLVTTPPMPRFQGYLDALSIGHAAGWLRDLNEPAARLTMEAWLDGALIARAAADTQTATLAALGLGPHGFSLTFPRHLTQAARDRVEIKVAGHTHALEHAPALSCDVALIGPLEIQLIGVQGTMAPDVLALALRWLAYVPPGGAVLTGAPDALAFPDLTALIASVPYEYRDRLTLRTHFAHRAPPIVFERIAKSMIGFVHKVAPPQPDKFHTEQQAALTAAIARLNPAMRAPKLTPHNPPNTTCPFTATITQNGRITINEQTKNLILDERLTDPETLLDRLAG